MKKNALLFTLFLAISWENLPAQSYFPVATDMQKWEYVTLHFWGAQCELRIIKTGVEQKR